MCLQALIGKDMRLPDWVVLMATLVGMAVFGINGFVIGPVIVAVFFSVWHIVLLDWRAPAGTDAAELARGSAACKCRGTPSSTPRKKGPSMAPETLAAAQRVAQQGARSAMPAARARASDDSQHGAALPDGAAHLPPAANSAQQDQPA